MHIHTTGFHSACSLQSAATSHPVYSFHSHHSSLRPAVSFPLPMAMNLLLAIVSLIVWTSPVRCLYEDQVNKWDWRRSFVGEVDQVIGHHLSPMSSVIVSTHSSVIAAISVRNGSIIYRHVLEEGAVINLIDTNDQFFGLKDDISPTSSLMSVSSNGKYIRKWDGKGALLYEKSLPITSLDDEAAAAKQMVFALDQDKNEVAVAEVTADAITARVFSLKTMAEKQKHVYAIPDTSGISSILFLASETGFTLIAADTKDMSIKVLAAGQPVKSLPLKSLGHDSGRPGASLELKSLSKQKAGAIISLRIDREVNILLRVQGTAVTLVKIVPKSIAIAVSPVNTDMESFGAFVLIGEPDEVRRKGIEAARKYRIAVFDLGSWKEIAALNSELEIASPADIRSFTILPVIKSSSGPVIKSYKVLVTLADASVHLISPQTSPSPTWTREESLADIITSEFIDYPLSEIHASIEQAFLSAESSNLITNFVNRIKSQVQQLQSLVKVLAADARQLIVPSHSLTQKQEPLDGKSLTRDYFGLRKLIVILTSSGKLIGMDTQTGDIIWSLFDEELSAEIGKQSDKNSVTLLIQRTSSYYSLPAVACVITKSGFLYTFDPVTGVFIQRERIGNEVKQLLVLPFTDEHHVRGFLLLTTADKAVIRPQNLVTSFLDKKDCFFIMTSDPNTGLLQGYGFKTATKDDLSANIVWSTIIPIEDANGASGSNPDLQVVFKRNNEQVHSLGRVLGDRNVLYKYLNPNLVAVSTIRSEATIGNENQQIVSGLVDLYLIDAVTGRIVHSASHKKSKGPVFIVHSENSVIYSYYNEKSRRTEISSIDLYEGLTQVNGSIFSSIDEGTSSKLVVEHNTFIFPTGIRVMTDTVTEKGLTNKHLLIALASGGLLELPKAFLDPRRPLVPTNEHREEGLIPYIPELPIPSEGFVNYNKSLIRVKSIQTAGSGLESTCLLLAHGLDLFHSRVTPSKTFDILKDDFDHLLISAVLVIMILVAYGSKWAAAHKSLKSAWT